MCFAVQAAAPTIAAFFHEPRCEETIRVVAAWLVARGLASPGMALLAKELSFKRVFAVSLFETVVNIVTAIAFGLIFKNAIGIALAFVATELAKSMVSYWLHPYRPKLSFSWALWREYASFGRWVLLANVSIFLAHALDGAIVGRVLGPSALGFYAIGVRAADLIRVNFAETIAQIYYSVFSKLQDRADSLRQLFKRLCSGVSLFAVVCGIVTIVGVYLTIQLIIGEKWRPAFVPTIGLVAAAVLRPIPALATKLFYAIGRPRLGVWINLVSLSIVATTCWAMTSRFGLWGAVISVLFSSLAATIVSLLLVRTALGATFKLETKGVSAGA
jgi:O-antigen/teichoic acid export membrane protein